MSSRGRASRTLRLLLPIVAVLTVAGATAAPAHAANAAADDAAAAEAITVAPTVISRTVRRGERFQLTVTVKNQTTRPFTFSTQVLDLEPGTGDQPELVSAGSAERGSGRWFSVTPRSFSLGAGTERDVMLTGTVPQDAPSGSAAAALVLQASPGGPGNLRVRTEVPAYVFLDVQGRARRDLDVELRADERLRLRGGRVRWELVVHNRGDVLEVLDAASFRVEGVLAADSREPIRPLLVLPGARRTLRFDEQARDAPDLLRGRATFERARSLDDASRDQPAGDLSSVDVQAPRTLVLPWWLVLLAGLVVATVTWRRRRRRRPLARDGS